MNLKINDKSLKSKELSLTEFLTLLVLKDNNLHSISFPLISSGIFGGNLENPAVTSAEQCEKAYDRFIEENKDYDIDVLLCAYSDNEYHNIVKNDIS